MEFILSKWELSTQILRLGRVEERMRYGACDFYVIACDILHFDDILEEFFA